MQSTDLTSNAVECALSYPLDNEIKCCLKDDAFAKNLEADEVIRYDTTLSRYFLHYAEEVQQKQNKHIETLIKNPPKKDRLFSEYLKRYE